jgi:hypothetical protein
VNAVVAALDIGPEPDDRMQAAVVGVLTDYPLALPLVERAARGTPPLREHESAWLADWTSEAAQIAQSPSFPPVSESPLPALYDAACRALDACAAVDECKDWADKGAALSSYARQVKDNTLRDFAMRIQARAVRRCGQLLLQIAEQRGRRIDLQPDAGTGTRSRAAALAGLSPRQMHTVLRVAGLPDAEFDAAVEASPPATVTVLAARGTAPRTPSAARAATPAEVTRSTRALLRQIAVGYDTHEGVREYCDSVGINSALLRRHAAALPGGAL